MPQKNKQCRGLTFADCELAILRMAVDDAEEKMGKRIVLSDDVQKMFDIVEDFIRRKKLICYGGTAINNILPEEDQFYNKDVEVPDYDFFSANAQNDAKELADIYYKKGFIDVEAKSGQHHGTYKVFVNFMAVADITSIPLDIYNVLKKEAISVGGILYSPPNFLRMSMYLELSRPAGDTSRWEKVLKRLVLLNKHYPITESSCDDINFQRDMELKEDDKEARETIYEVVQNSLINQGVVFFGGFANALYSQYMPSHLKHKLKHYADFDVLSNDPSKTAQIVKERLEDNNIHNVKIIRHPPSGEIVPEHIEIRIKNDSILFIYRPVGCHSYNIHRIHGKKIKVATIDTMLSFYLAFLYANRPYYNQFIERILCMSKFLFDVQQKNRLEQRGLLKRFSITCYGHQPSVEEIKAEKAKKYKELKTSKNPNAKKEFSEWFMNYRPGDRENSSTREGDINNRKTRRKRASRKTIKRKFKWF